MDALVIFGAKYLIYIVVLTAVAAVLISPQRSRLAPFAALALALGYALARIAGLFWGHQQPFALEGSPPLVPHAVDNAFPSDHMLLGGVLAFVGYLFDWRFGVVLFVLTLGVGVARVAAGLHYPIDILAALVLAAVALSGAYAALRFLKLY